MHSKHSPNEDHNHNQKINKKFYHELNTSLISWPLSISFIKNLNIKAKTIPAALSPALTMWLPQFVVSALSSLAHRYTVFSSPLNVLQIAYQQESYSTNIIPLPQLLTHFPSNGQLDQTKASIITKIKKIPAAKQIGYINPKLKRSTKVLVW